MHGGKGTEEEGSPTTWTAALDGYSDYTCIPFLDGGKGQRAGCGYNQVLVFKVTGFLFCHHLSIPKLSLTTYHKLGD